MIAPRPVLAALLVLPSVVVSGAEAWLVRHARGVGEGLGAAFAALAPEPAPAPDEEPPPEGPPPLELADDGTQAAPARADASKRPNGRARSKSKAPPPPKVRGLYVDGRTVLRLAAAGNVPSGTPVAATAERPAGLSLRGVQGLGVGLQEGDVLAEVEGRAVRTEGQVIATVISARARRAPWMSARFFRGTEPWVLTVEMPYLEAHPEKSASGGVGVPPAPAPPADKTPARVPRTVPRR